MSVFTFALCALLMMAAPTIETPGWGLAFWLLGMIGMLMNVNTIARAWVKNDHSIRSKKRSGKPQGFRYGTGAMGTMDTNIPEEKLALKWFIHKYGTTWNDSIRRK